MRNRTFRAFVTVAVLVQLTVPLGTAAVGADSRAAQRGKAAQTERICANIDKIVGNAASRFGERRGKLGERRDERDAKLSELRKRRNERLAGIRVQYDERHDTRISLMLSKAGDDAAKTAILEFQRAVKDALVVRRAAYDKAIDDYRTAVDAAIDSRTALVNAAVDKLQSAIDSATAEAKTACAVEGADWKAIRETLQAALQSARNQFRNDMQAIPPFGTSINPLVEVRNAAFKAAHETFRASVEAARDTLKKKLKELRPAEGDDEEDVGTSA